MDYDAELAPELRRLQKLKAHHRVYLSREMIFNLVFRDPGTGGYSSAHVRIFLLLDLPSKRIICGRLKPDIGLKIISHPSFLPQHSVFELQLVLERLVVGAAHPRR